jgi:hypothetical protein
MSKVTLPPELRVGAEQPDRNLALDLVRVTEAAAMAAGYHQLSKRRAHSSIDFDHTGPIH